MPSCLRRKEELRDILQEFSGVDRVGVAFSASPGKRGAKGSRGRGGVCSEHGTSVTITFERVSLEVSRLARRPRGPPGVGPRPSSGLPLGVA